jgi:hypothetical protein
MHFLFKLRHLVKVLNVLETDPINANLKKGYGSRDI